MNILEKNKKMKINDIIDAKCRDISFDGKGVAETKEGIVFIDGFFPGEEGQIQIIYHRNGSFFGRLKHLSKISPDRIEPKCPVCAACGGCQFQQLRYESQLQFKENFVKKLLLQKLKNKENSLPIIGMKNPYHYRNKIALPLKSDKYGNLIMGFYHSLSNKIVPIKECVIEDENINKIIFKLKIIFQKLNIKVYDETENSGLLRRILVKTSLFYGDIMVVIVTNRKDFKEKDELVKMILSECPNVTTLIQNVNDQKTNVILGKNEYILYGNGYIKERILDLDFIISSQSFFQVNPRMMIELYKVAISFANLKPNDVFFDAYSGIGTISLIASKYVRQVYGVEIVEDAVKNAKENAKINEIENVSFLLGDAGEFLKEYAHKNIHFDVVMVDPPRKGLTDIFINELLKALPSRIVYISCNPLTLNRDLEMLKDQYELVKAQPVDMFPFTKHIETVCLLERKTIATKK